MEYKFKVNLGGIIDLLSQHIYSSPQVFIRELLQNSVDAIVARRQRDAHYEGAVEIELPERAAGERPLLIFRDNGIGLTEEEVHLFLATIGQTSKRTDEPKESNDFLGQFGIGLLSCFVVSDEIVVLTRSAKGAECAVEWRGRADGTYTLNRSDDRREAGTEVRLYCKEGSEEYFSAEAVRRLALHFGSLLPFPITLKAGGRLSHINGERAPWEESFSTPELEREAYLEYGRQTFGMEFLDYVPLRTSFGDVEGAAFVLPFAPSLSMKKTHRVYLKRMLLSEKAEGLLPDWAFFVKCIVNANGLRPTASRESFYEDELLAETRDALGRKLRNYLMQLAEEHPSRLKKLIQLHYLSIKALAVDDDEFFRIFVNWLPFETNMGTMTLTEYRKEHAVVRFAPDLDQFRQIARVAASQSLCVINAAYTYDVELLRKLADATPGLRLTRVDSTSLSHAFEYLTLDEQDEVEEFVQSAERVLDSFNCSVEVRKFSPEDLPALYNAGSDEAFRRTIETTKEVTDKFWSGLLDSVQETRQQTDSRAELCFNYRNPVIYKIVRTKDETLLRLSVQMLYVQALLLSHRPLNAKELALLNEGLMGFLEWSADTVVEWIQ